MRQPKCVRPNAARVAGMGCSCAWGLVEYLPDDTIAYGRGLQTGTADLNSISASVFLLAEAGGQ